MSFIDSMHFCRTLFYLDVILMIVASVCYAKFALVNVSFEFEYLSNQEKSHLKVF